jgi:hypothetical protein
MAKTNHFKHTDVDRLHKVIEDMNNPCAVIERGAGVTFAQCHELAGVMETTEQSGVFCKIERYDRIRHILQMLFSKVLPDHNIKFVQNGDYPSFHLPDGQRKKIKFILYHESEQATRGSLWPVVEFWD